MKKTILSFCCLLFAVSSVFAKKVETVTLAASDPLVTYVGRTFAKDGTVSYDWSAVKATVKFEGTTLSMSTGPDSRCYLNLWIDKKPVPQYDMVLKIEGAQSVVLVANLKRGVHEVTIQKRSEGEQGSMTIENFSCDGRFLQASSPLERRIEFVGDSYTCGYGTEGADRDQPFRTEEENCNLTYAAILGRYFDADAVTICHSGQGIIRNYNGQGKDDDMVRRYLRTFDQKDKNLVWNASEAQKPDIVVIYLGTNDFSCGLQPFLEAWCGAYATLLKEIRSNYGDEVPILCVASKANEEMDRYVELAATRSGVPNVHWTAIHEAAHNDISDLGSSWHPNYAGHRKVASCMLPYISTLTGWDLPLKVVE